MSGALVLASSSTSRRTMLEAAGVPFTVVSPSIDEDLVKSLLIDGGADPHAIAEELAQAKALSVSGHRPDALTLGADQMLVCNGRMFNKALTEQDARDTLVALAGRERA